MNKQQDIEKFGIVCKNCEAKGIRSATNLHIDFKKKYYLFICYDCGETEAFDENNERVNKNENEAGGGEIPSNIN